MLRLAITPYTGFSAGAAATRPQRRRRVVDGVPRAIALAVCLLMAAGGRGLEAQGRPLRVQARQALDFGLIIQGVPEPVIPSDGVRAGHYRVRGIRNAEILIEFLLPTGLSGPGGVVVALSFAVSDGAFTTTGIGAAQFFDPRTPTPFSLSRQGRGEVFLGGTAFAPPGIASGSYSAPVTLVVSYTGN